MDLINNLVFTALNQVETFINPPQDFFLLPPILTGGGPGTPAPRKPEPINRGNYFSYTLSVVQAFTALDDPRFLENAIQKHWADMVNGRPYTEPNPPISPPNNPDDNIYYSRFRTVPAPTKELETGALIPPYHLIYAYLVENTRIAQIFAKLIFFYMHDEKLNKASGSINNRQAFQWIVNTENLFFKTLPNNSFRNITSQLRLYEDKTRRNAYYRMFGMDLAFGDMDTNEPVNFYKAETNNQSFIVLFEKFISEIWQAYINSRNSSGANTTDYFQITDSARLIQEMLMSRRTTDNGFENYRFFNLSREEYAAVVMMSWFYEVVSYNSPVVIFLNCNGNSPAERLVNVGNKVGLPAHSKSEALLDIAPPMNTLLRRIELKDYSDQENVRRIIESQNATSSPTPGEIQALNDLLLIINNWEKATGHKIKNREANITGTVEVQQNGKQPVVMN